MIQKITSTDVEVLAYFFTYPLEEVHIRGLADKLDRPYSSVRSALLELEAEGLIAKREESKMTFFSANESSEQFRRRKQLHNLRALHDSGMLAALEETFRPDAIVLFGSYLHGTDIENSDIDIAIVNGRDTAVDLERYEAALHRTIQIVLVQDPREEQPEFRNTLSNGHVLTGYLAVV